MKKNKEEERFSLEQRQQLAVLHDDIDEFNDRFYFDFGENIIYTAASTPSLGKSGKRKIKPKKNRHIFAVDFKTLPEEVSMSGAVFYSRMMIITENISVKSIVDKLITFYPNAGRLTISSNRSHRVFNENFSKIEGMLDNAKSLAEPSDDVMQEIEMLEELLAFMRTYNQTTISGRSYSDHITCSIYSHKEEVLASRIFFRGGIVIPKECSFREPVTRKPRNDNKEKHYRVIGYGNKSYVMDRLTQYPSLIFPSIGREEKD